MNILTKEVNIQGVIQLPISLFKNKEAGKSILILQKKADDLKSPKQVLLVNMPSLSNASEVEKILVKIDHWINENK